MPRTIYETRHPNHATPPSFVPERWAYIGETVQNHDGKWRKAPVWNRVQRSWWQLNSEVNGVDFVLRDITYHSVLMDIVDEDSADFGEFRLTVTPDGTEVTLPDDTDTHLITGLTPLTEYTVALKVWIITNPDTSDPDSGTGGFWSEADTHTFTTLDNPVPLTPVLQYPSITNSYVDLKWIDSARSSAVEYVIYKGVGDKALLPIKTVTGKTGRLLLSKDTKYRFAVAGVNAEGLEGPQSNIIRWATGHDKQNRKGSIHRLPLGVHEFGSWRPDIGWNDWHYWPTRFQQDSIFQGFWTNDNRRYRGCITYKQAEFRHTLDRQYGAGVSNNLRTSRAEIGRVYRMRYPGNAASQYLLWHLIQVNVFDSSGPPPSYSTHRNNRNDADALAAQDRLKAGTYHDNLRLPRSWGNALVRGKTGSGTLVNGIMMYRGDEENNGYGTAGYMECSGHQQRDRGIPGDAWRVSNWTIYISATWDFPSEPYKAPYQW